MDHLKIYSVLIAAYAFSTSGSFAGYSLESTVEKVHLLELYSSEGCSSCPPADAWLSALRKNPALFRRFVPVEFHIDYWNRLGWHDPFSEDRFTSRQYALASAWGKNSVYTPGFVLDAKEWRVGEGMAGVTEKGNPVGVLRVDRRGENDFLVTFRPVGKGAGPYRIYGARLGNGFLTEVKSGENSGRRLAHDFTATQFSSSAMKPGPSAGSYTVGVSLVRGGVNRPKSESVAFWVTTPGNEVPIQVVGGDLPEFK